MPTLSEDLRFRGIVHQVTDEAILARLDAGGVSAYIGFDPTARSLHVGNLMQLITLRRLQLAGNRPIVVAGGGTGAIGDPSGRSSERNLQSDEQIAENIASVREQLGAYLDFSDDAGAASALLVDNSTWLRPITMIDFLRDVGKYFTVNQMVAKDSVRSRFDRPDVGISYTEFSYMLLQAYDFLRLHVDHGCDLQMGASDQWGNITMGVELIRKVTGDQAFGLTTPLMTKADGTKLGKSMITNESVWLDRSMTSPFALYQFFLNVEDEIVGTMLRFLTFLEHDEILELERTNEQQPQQRAAQRALAFELVSFVHSRRDAESAKAASSALFDESIATLDADTLAELVAEVPSSTIAISEIDAGVTVVELLARTALTSSISEARRAIDQGGVYLNNVRVGDAGSTLGKDQLLHGRFALLRRGKRNQHLLVAA